MAVVINEFEAIAEAPPATAGEATDDRKDGKPPRALQPSAVAPAMRQLHQQALRVWAH